MPGTDPYETRAEIDSVLKLSSAPIPSCYRANIALLNVLSDFQIPSVANRRPK